MSAIKIQINFFIFPIKQIIHKKPKKGSSPELSATETGASSCEENYLLALVRYIHLKPIRAGIIKTIEEH